MSYQQQQQQQNYPHHKQEWQGYRDDDDDGVAGQEATGHHSGAHAPSSPFHDDRRQDSFPSVSPAAGPSSPYQNRNGHSHPQDDDDDEQYPVGRPLSYFPTHHQPLAQDYDDDPRLQNQHSYHSGIAAEEIGSRTSQYHQMSPLQHAQSPLSSRSDQWSGNNNAYSGYQQQGSTDIPMVGMDIISSNLEATRNGNRSDTRSTAGDFEDHRQNGVQATDSVYSAGAGVGAGAGAGAGAQGIYNQHQNQHQQQYDNKQGYNDGGYSQQNQAPYQLPGEGARGSAVQVEDGEPIPKALLDPKVQKQLNKRKVWRPWFIWLVSAVQVAVLIFEFVKGYQRTHEIIQTSPFNPMIGPGTGTIIAVGARFVPCMRSTYLDSIPIQCPDNTTLICNISDICAFTPINTTGKPPNQWFRFITPIFLHGGIIHLGFNLMFQLRTGADLERDMGWWRISIIYMTSGIAGFIFGGNFAPLLSPSMGASGAIFGLIGCLVLDLIQNWKLVVRPCWELSKLSLMILVSFAFGLLPFLDNFAHIGGFIGGILTGLVFMPVVYFSKRDKYIKWGLRVVALPCVVVLIVVGLTNFYKGVNNCSWCRYLSCLPINGWCDAFNPPAGAPTTGAGGA